MSGSSSSVFTTPHLWGLNTLFWTFLQLPLCVILGHSTLTLPVWSCLVFRSLPKEEGVDEAPWHHSVYLCGNHVIAGRVQILGVIVAIERKSRFTILTLDDGTGLLPCLWWPPTPGSDLPIQLGDTCHIRGKLDDSYHQIRQLRIYQIGICNVYRLFHSLGKCTDPRQELHWIKQTALLAEKIYNQPFQLPENWLQWTQKSLVASADTMQTENDALLLDLIDSITGDSGNFSVSFIQLLMHPRIDSCLKLSDKNEADILEWRAVQLSQVLSQLVSSGALTLKDAARQIYEYLSPVKHIAPHIMREMPRLQQSLNVAGRGVALHQMMQLVKKQFPIDANIEKQTNQAIEHLVAEGALYKVQQNEYRLFTM